MKALVLLLDDNDKVLGSATVRGIPPKTDKDPWDGWSERLATAGQRAIMKAWETSIK